MYQDRLRSNTLGKLRSCPTARDIKALRKVVQRWTYNIHKAQRLPFANCDKGLMFQTKSTTGGQSSGELSMYMVNRDRDAVALGVSRSHQTGSSSSESSMLQRWEKETFKEQPFHNVGAVIGAKSDAGSVGLGEKGQNDGEFGS